MFSRGAREAVLLAALVATGQAGRYEELVALDEPERTNRLLAGADLGAESRTLLRDLLAAELA
jgi:hypothetical protein